MHSSLPTLGVMTLLALGALAIAEPGAIGARERHARGPPQAALRRRRGAEISLAIRVKSAAVSPSATAVSSPFSGAPPASSASACCARVVPRAEQTERL